MLENILDMLNIIWSILFMVFFFGFCIFIHELGHFLVARMCGLHVISFSIGFKKVWAKKIRGVEYRIGCIPLGGYVEIPQIDSSGDSEDENGKPLEKVNPWKRIATVFAGPFFNILFGLALGCLIWIFGIPQDTPKMSQFEVQSIEENSPEWNAGLRKNDVITKLNGKTFHCTWTEFAREIMLNVGEVSLEATDTEGQVKNVVYKPIVNKNIAPKEEIPYPFFRPEIPVIGYPEKDSPAMEAGIRKGDRIISVNNKEIISIEDLEISVLFSQGKPMNVEVIRDKEVKRFIVTPRPYPDMQDSSFYQLGMQFESNGKVLRVEKIYDNMPCHGLLFSKDRIIAADGIPMESNLQFIRKVRQSNGKTIRLTVLRNDEFLHVDVTPVFIVPHYIGLTYKFMVYPTPFEQFRNTMVLTWRSLRSVSAGVGGKIGLDSGYTTLGPKHFSGPIGIGRSLFLTVYHAGFMMGINLVVLISFSLAIVNLLPVPLPVFDGGHIVLQLLEIIFRKPISKKLLMPPTYAFIGLLIAFMLFVSYYDVKKILPFPSKEETKTEILSEQFAERVLKVEKALQEKENLKQVQMDSISKVKVQDVFPETDTTNSNW